MPKAPTLYAESPKADPLPRYDVLRFVPGLLGLRPLLSCSLCNARTDWANDVIFLLVGLTPILFAPRSWLAPPSHLKRRRSHWLEIPATLQDLDANGSTTLPRGVTSDIRRAGDVAIYDASAVSFCPWTSDSKIERNLCFIQLCFCQFNVWLQII